MSTKNAYKHNEENVKALKNSDDDLCCCLKFTYCHKKYPLENLSYANLKSFVVFAKKIEKLTWKEIKINSGLCYEVIKNNKNLDNKIPDGFIARSLRVEGKFRILGFRDKEYFYIVWFTNNHDET
jgi:hypothetical protein